MVIDGYCPDRKKYFYSFNEHSVHHNTKNTLLNTVLLSNIQVAPENIPTESKPITTESLWAENHI